MANESRLAIASNFGRLLRGHRLAAGFSQENLAERARMSVNGISALERGYRQTPKFQTLALLAGALALSDEERREFVAAAARSGTVRGGGSVTVGPWPENGTPPIPIAHQLRRQGDGTCGDRRADPRASDGNADGPGWNR